MNAVALVRRLLPDEFQAHQPALRRARAPNQGFPTHEIVFLGLQRHRETDAGLEGIGPVVELVVGENQTGLDPHHVQCIQTEGREAMRLAGGPDGIPYAARVARMAPHLEAQLAGIAGAGDDDRYPGVIADPADGEAEPAQLPYRRLGRRRPHDGIEDLPAPRPLDRHVVKLLGRRPDPDVETELHRLLAHPLAVMVRTADPAEIVRTQAEDGAVVDHAAGLVAHGGVDHLAGGQPAHVPGEHPLHQTLRVRPQNLELAQRRQVHDRGPLAAGPVLVQSAAVGEAAGQPVAVVFGEAPGVSGKPVVETGLAGQFGIGVGGHAMGHRG